MPTPNEIVDKIRNLLRLADNAGSPEEAANAMGVARSLMARHRVDRAMLDVTVEEQEPVQGERVVDTGTDHTTEWVWTLFQSICEVNNCRGFVSSELADVNGQGGKTEKKKRATLNAIGRESDRKVVMYMFLYIKGQVDQLCLADARKELMAPTPSWRHSWRLAASRKIDQRIRERAEAEEAEARRAATQGMSSSEGEKGLARVDQDLALVGELVKGVAEGLGLHSKKTKNAGVSHHDAAAKGRVAGEKVDISPRRGKGLGSSANQLEG